MKTLIGTNTYEVTEKNGVLAVRKLNHKGGTALWIGADTTLGRVVLEQVGLAPKKATP